MRLFFRAQGRSNPRSFEGRSRKSGDPWHFAGSPYEQQRYLTILAALGHRHYRRAFEPGCAVGVLSERLAGLCDAVEASDVSPAVVAQAQARCAHLSNVQVSCRPLAKTDTAERFDLVVLSEIGYYFDAEDWAATVASLVGSMRPGTTVLGCHWLGHSPDHRLTGDAVHEALIAQPALQLEHSERHEGFRLDRWCRA